MLECWWDALKSCHIFHVDDFFFVFCPAEISKGSQSSGGRLILISFIQFPGALIHWSIQLALMSLRGFLRLALPPPWALSSSHPFFSLPHPPALMTHHPTWKHLLHECEGAFAALCQTIPQSCNWKGKFFKKKIKKKLFCEINGPKF